MLQLKNVSAGYGGQAVIRDICLRLEPGMVYSIVGRNGCGKSTLLKTCAGMLETSEGSILLDGRELKQHAPGDRARLVSYLSQSRNTPAISAERLVEHGRYPRLASPRRLSDSDRRMIETSMDRMQIMHLRKKNLQQLSGGERQRVYIAMLLAQDTPVLLMDEPAVYLDIDYRLALLDLTRELKQEGKCIVMVLHDLAHALQYSDRIIAMENGRVAGFASPEAILADGILEKIFNIKIETCGNAEKTYLVRR